MAKSVTMNLYTLTAVQQQMRAQLDEMGFDAKTIADTLEGEDNTDALREKRLGYVAIIKSKRAFAIARYTAAQSINELAEREAETADRLEAALFSSMLATGDADLIGLEFEAHIKGKPAAVIITDLSKVPVAYMRTPEPKPPVPAPDKKAIAAAFAAGQQVDGCELGLNKKLIIY